VAAFCSKRVVLCSTRTELRSKILLVADDPEHVLAASERDTLFPHPLEGAPAAVLGTPIRPVTSTPSTSTWKALSANMLVTRSSTS